MPSRTGLALLGVLTALAMLAPRAEARYGFAIAPSAAPAGATLELSFRAPWANGTYPDAHYLYVMTIHGPSEACLHRAFPEVGHGPPDPTSVFDILQRFGALRINGKLASDHSRIDRGDALTLRIRAPRCAGDYRGVVEYDQEFTNEPFKFTVVGRYALQVAGPHVLASTGIDTRLVAAAGVTLLLGGIGLRGFAKLRCQIGR